MLEVTRHTLAVRHPSCIERRLTPPLLISNLKGPRADRLNEPEGVSDRSSRRATAQCRNEATVEVAPP